MPLLNSRKALLVVEPQNSGLALISAAQRHGHAVVVLTADREERRLPQQERSRVQLLVADTHDRLAALAAVLELTRGMPLDGVVAGGSRYAPLATALARHLGLADLNAGIAYLALPDGSEPAYSVIGLAGRGVAFVRTLRGFEPSDLKIGYIVATKAPNASLEQSAGSTMLVYSKALPDSELCSLVQLATGVDMAEVMVSLALGEEKLFPDGKPAEGAAGVLYLNERRTEAENRQLARRLAALPNVVRFQLTESGESAGYAMVAAATASEVESHLFSVAAANGFATWRTRHAG